MGNWAGTKLHKIIDHWSNRLQLPSISKHIYNQDWQLVDSYTWWENKRNYLYIICYEKQNKEKYPLKIKAKNYIIIEITGIIWWMIWKFSNIYFSLYLKEEEFFILWFKLKLLIWIFNRKLRHYFTKQLNLTQKYSPCFCIIFIF